ASTTPYKPDNQEQSSEHEISPTTLDVVLTLSQSKTRARSAKIIYKRLKKQQSFSGLDFTDAVIPAVRRVSAGGADPAVVISAGGADPDIVVFAGGANFEAERQELLEQELKQSLDAEKVYLDSLLAQRVAEEQDKEIRASTEQSTPRQVELDRIALNLTNEEWIGLVYQSSHNTEQSAELPDTTSVSAGATIAVGDPNYAVPYVPVVPSVFAASSIPTETPIAAGVSTTAGVSESAGVASVPIIDLIDSPPKATSLPLDPATAEQALPLRKSTRKKSIDRRRTLPRPSQSESAALPFDEDDPEAEFKKYLRQVSDDDEPAEPVSLSLVSDIRTWEIIPTEFGLGEIYVISRADGTVKRFSTLRELMYWVGRADLMVLYGMVSDKYKLERATSIGLGLCSDLRTLITAREDRDASIIWDDQD
nr:hypothetical protein [Tanacetum cinerariifolium]